MTPAARIAAAIEILDRIEEGAAAEQLLTAWGRKSRFAGSKDRAAVRDLVFSALRHWRSDAARGGGRSGRLRMLGRLRAEGLDPGAFFTGEGHAPAPLAEAELCSQVPSELQALDVPDWLWPQLLTDLGDEAETTARAWQDRAPVTLRVNLSKGDVDTAQAMLRRDDIETERNPRAEAALTVISNARRVRLSPCYIDGFVEIQDASSQAVCDTVPYGVRVLDYCAGGGGKALALASGGREVVAHDAKRQRMEDIPARASRAGVEITLAETGELGSLDPFDIVLCDAPCSGSGAWRRSPEGKWALSAERLEELVNLQAQILDKASKLLRPGGWLIYATCSVLSCENDRQIAGFLARHPGWAQKFSQNWSVADHGDGFFVSHLTQKV